MNKSEDYYKDNWDEYYLSVSNKVESIPWDVEASRACELDYERFSSYFDSSLPVMDLGCGIGTQSHFLSQYYEKIIGVDVSPEIIRLAIESNLSPNATFSVFDVLDVSEAEKFHCEHGDMNIYIRGILQQILHSDRGEFSKVIQTLLGNSGCLYFIEISTKAPKFFGSLANKLGGLGPGLTRVLRNRVTKLVGVDGDTLTDIFPTDGFLILQSGDGVISLKADEAGIVGVPAVYGIVKLLSSELD